LAIINNATHAAHTYIKFNLAGWLGKTLDEEDGALLKLRITSNEIPANQDTRIRFKRITENWSEGALKWSNAPSIGSSYKTKVIHSGDSGTETYNLTGLVQEMLDHEGCCGLYIEIDDYVVWFASSDGAYTPRLYLTEAVPTGDILSGTAQPTSQEAGESVDVAVDIKNVGSIGGYFKLQYYEGSTHLRTASRAWLDANQTVTDISEVFLMPNRDFIVSVRMYNETTEAIDDTYDVTCYLSSGMDYYVKTEGNDSAAGSSWDQAWQTVDKAARTVPDGSVVHIGFGEYSNEPAGNLIAPQNVGGEGITYSPETAGSEGGTGTVIIEKNI
ncbi:MAG: hypothetical protein DRI69_12200, partial [Bacteroidetes bacterium]